MKRIVAVLLLLSLTQLPAVFAQEGGSHQKAAEQVLTLMDMEAVMSRTVDEMLKAQIQADPRIAPFEDVMKRFLAKYMSWNSLKPDIVKLYMEQFTEQELNEITKFYQTPAGKKAVQSMPDLMSKGAQIGVQRVQEHMPELQAAIAEEAKKHGADKKEASDKKK